MALFNRKTQELVQVFANNRNNPEEAKRQAAAIASGMTREELQQVHDELDSDLNKTIRR